MQISQSWIIQIQAYDRRATYPTLWSILHVINLIALLLNVGTFHISNFIKVAHSYLHTILPSTSKKTPKWPLSQWVPHNQLHPQYKPRYCQSVSDEGGLVTIFNKMDFTEEAEINVMISFSTRFCKLIFQQSYKKDRSTLKYFQITHSATVHK